MSKKNRQIKSTQNKDVQTVSEKSPASGNKQHFSHILHSVLHSSLDSNIDFKGQSAPLAHLDYSQELKHKNRAVKDFWERMGLPGELEQVVPSPRPRHYRTTSNRKAALRGSTLYLSMGGKKPSRQQKSFDKSNLEPESHTRIYRFLRSKISESPFQIVGKHLNYIIIRGNYQEQAVIFNVDEMNGPLVRKLKILGEHLQSLSDRVCAAFIYPDPTGSSYYLEEKRPPEVLKLKKLFGKSQLELKVAGCRYLYPPTSFSQVNESMLPVMLETVHELLQPREEERLIDLYCGYGLFSHYLASCYRQVVGVEAEGEAIEAAIANKKSNPTSGKLQFISKAINKNNLQELLPFPDTSREAVIMDPPRQGPKRGVISELCNRQPGKVLHIHCNTDLIPESVREWEKGGYRPSKVVPLDMFPGTPHLEVLIKFEPV